VCCIRGQHINTRVREGKTEAEDTGDGHSYAGLGKRKSNSPGMTTENA